MLHDSANDGRFVGLKRAAEDRGMGTQRQNVRTCSAAGDCWLMPLRQPRAAMSLSPEGQGHVKVACLQSGSSWTAPSQCRQPGYYSQNVVVLLLRQLLFLSFCDDCDWSLQFTDVTQRADWLRVLQHEAKVEQCDLFITARKSLELHNSGEYAEVIQFERQPTRNPQARCSAAGADVYEEIKIHHSTARTPFCCSINVHIHTLLCPAPNRRGH